MRITFHGAAGCVTGSCYELETQGQKFLVDCGMFQGPKSLRELNYGKFAFDVSAIAFVLVTHAHIDHTGLLPKLVKHGFSGPIFATEPTADLLEYMLLDSAHIQESEVEQKNRRNARRGLDILQPIYDETDARAAIALMKPVKTGKVVKPADGISAVFRNAGHLLGSAFIELTIQEGTAEKRITFSGDLGAKGHPIVEDPEYASATDVLLVESTYGDRVRPPDSKEGRLKCLSDVVNDTLRRGGNLIIPAFAVERTQDLMHDLTVLMESGEIPETEVVIDSPLASDSTKVFAKYTEYYDEDATNLLQKRGKLFDAAHFRFVRSVEESKQLNEAHRLIIMSSSGMCDAGRIKHHLKHQLWKPENTVLFVGYQAEGTLGRLLLEGAKTVRIYGEEVSVKAKIVEMPGYSGHADQKALLEWVSKISEIRENIFIVHGEAPSSKALAAKIAESRQCQIVVPVLGRSYDLAAFKALLQQPAVLEERHETLKGDSHNLYAALMLQIADFMRTQPDEQIRRKVLMRLFEALKAKENSAS